LIIVTMAYRATARTRANAETLICAPGRGDRVADPRVAGLQQFVLSAVEGAARVD
jgi:hypothetical protein